MRILLDTHVFLWFVQNDSKLDERWFDFIETSGHSFLVSHVAPWEITIKHALGKLKLDREPDELFPLQLQINGFEFLPIRLPHILRQGKLPAHHRDPFDRLMVAQCEIEGIKMISLDPQLRAYGVLLEEP